MDQSNSESSLATWLLTRRLAACLSATRRLLTRASRSGLITQYHPLKIGGGQGAGDVDVAAIVRCTGVLEDQFFVRLHVLRKADLKCRVDPARHYSGLKTVL